MIRHLAAHPSARACLILLGLAFACAVAETLCTLTGVPA